MTSKEYLNRAFQFENRIASKIEQIERLRAMTMKVTQTISEVKVQTSPNPNRIQDALLKAIALEDELVADAETLIDIRKEVTDTIRKVDDTEQQLILEKRYLCYESWEDIAIDLSFSIQHTFRLHGEALNKVEEILGMRVNESK